MIFRIPVTNDPRQTFTTIIKKKTVEFNIHWNGREEKWLMDIAVHGEDKKTEYEMYAKGVPISSGLNLVQYYELGIGRVYGFNQSFTDLKPTRENFGNTYFLYVDDSYEDE
jgi:hypothetical protein